MARKQWLIVLGIYLGILILLEGVGETIVYWKESKHPSGMFGEDILSHEEPVLGFGLKKRIKKTMGNWSVTTNGLGFRDNQELPKEKPAGEFRVFIVGGSTVFGWGLNDNYSIPNRIQSLVDSYIPRELASMHKVRVINAGVPWYASWHEAALIFFHVMELNPDFIIVMDGLNDTADAMAPTWSPIVDGFVDTPTRIAYERRKANESLSSPFVNFLEISPAFRYFYSKWKNHGQLEVGAPHPEAWDQYIGYMHRLKTLTDANGIKFHIFFQPVMVVDKELIYTEIISDGTSMKNPEFASKFRDLYITGENRVLSDKTLPVTSLRTAFKEGKGTYMYLDGLHYTADGNQILAKLIFDDEVGPWLKKLKSTAFENPRSITSPPQK
jgi:hypothetical protein